MKISIQNRKIGILIQFLGIYLTLLGLFLKQKAVYSFVIVLYGNSIGLGKILSLSLLVFFTGLYLTIFFTDEILLKQFSYLKEKIKKTNIKALILMASIISLIAFSIIYYFQLLNQDKTYSIFESIFLGFMDNFLIVLGASIVIIIIRYLIKKSKNEKL